MADFLLGWATIDFANDDGYDVGTWSWIERKGGAAAMP